MPIDDSTLSLEQLRTLRRLGRAAGDVVEGAVRDRLSLRALMARFLPKLEGWLGARGAVVTTRNEHLVEDSYTWGAWEMLGGADLHDREGRARRVGSGTTLWTTLRIGGELEVGRVAVLLDGDRTGADAERDLHLGLDAIFEELDVVLETVHAAARKQRMIVEIEELLTDPVFERGVDRAIGSLCRETGLPDMVVVYRDEVERGRFHYRVYHGGALRHASDGNADRHTTLDAALAERGDALLEPDTRLLRLAAGMPEGVESMLSTGVTNPHWLGKVVCSAGAHGFAAFTLDVVEVMCEAMSKRLVDFNRERRHLAQFFAPPVIAELLNDPDYHDRYLTPREDTVAVLYADINSFTKLSEQVLEQPAAIAAFVDRWSTGAVDAIWDHGGVFDKMVGDCVIGLFGPPFFRDTPAERAHAALEAAARIARFTMDMERDPPYQAIAQSGVVPGLGVAIGLNLCPMAVGIMGPNQDYTGFSSGMNAAARLQSLAGFRQAYGMESLCEAVRGADDDFVRSIRFGEVRETPVKNVKLPLRYREIVFPNPT
jgi:class 3 adenylate cyclase